MGGEEIGKFRSRQRSCSCCSLLTSSPRTLINRMADAGLLDDTQSEETTFIPDDISAIIKEARAPSPPTAHAAWLANYRVL